MIQLFLSLLILLFIFYIFRLLSKKQVEMKNVLSWLLAAILLLPLVWFQSLIFRVAHLLGFQLSSNFIFLMALVFLIYLNFSLTRQVSVQSFKLRQLAQTLALLDKKFEVDLGGSEEEK